MIVADKTQEMFIQVDGIPMHVPRRGPELTRAWIMASQGSCLDNLGSVYLPLTIPDLVPHLFFGH